MGPPLEDTGSGKGIPDTPSEFKRAEKISLPAGLILGTAAAWGPGGYRSRMRRYGPVADAARIDGLLAQETLTVRHVLRPYGVRGRAGNLSPVRAHRHCRGLAAQPDGSLG